MRSQLLDNVNIILLSVYYLMEVEKYDAVACMDAWYAEE